MNVAAGAGDGDGDGDGDGLGFLTAAAEAAEPEAAADQPSRPTVIHSRSEAPSAGNRVVIAGLPCHDWPGGRRHPAHQVFGATRALHWSGPGTFGPRGRSRAPTVLLTK